MLRDGEALRALAAMEDDAAQSSFWRGQSELFSVDADGTMHGDTVLGSVSTKTGLLHSLAHWVLQFPFRRMGRKYRFSAKAQRLGRMIARRQGRQFTHDMVRQALTLGLVREFVEPADDGACNLVIGDGYGVMSSLLLQAYPQRRVIAVNLSKPLLLDLAQIRKADPDAGIALVSNREDLQEALNSPDVRVIAVRADDCGLVAEVPVALAVNIVSMQEMDPPVVAGYFEILRKNPAPRTAFYCCNKLWKRLPDGTESKLMAYPWRENDEILVDEACPWSQWIYDKAPPFWHYRRGERRVIWHRFAWMEKDRC